MAFKWWTQGFIPGWALPIWSDGYVPTYRFGQPLNASKHLKKGGSFRARSHIPVYGLTGGGLGGWAAGRQCRARDFTGKILE